MAGSSKIRFLLMLAACTTLLASCVKKEDYPVIPQIKFVSFTKVPNNLGIDLKGVLKISFTDGDGNIGLAQSDTLPPFNLGSPWYYNFFIDYYEKQNGEWKKIDLNPSFNSRIPPVTGTGLNKPTKGDIEIELDINNVLSPYDTIAFEASIADRDLQLSNVIRTPEIVVKKR